MKFDKSAKLLQAIISLTLMEYRFAQICFSKFLCNLLIFILQFFRSLPLLSSQCLPLSLVDTDEEVMVVDADMAAMVVDTEATVVDTEAMVVDADMVVDTEVMVVDADMAVMEDMVVVMEAMDTATKKTFN